MTGPNPDQPLAARADQPAEPSGAQTRLDSTQPLSRVASTGNGPPPLSAAGGDDPDWARVGKLLTRQVQKFRQLLPQVLSGQEGEAVHDLRVCTRRLQQIVLVLAIGTHPVRGRGLRRELRGVRSAVGNWRNCDVILQRVERLEIAARSPSRRAGWNLLREALEQRRRRQIRRAQRKLLKPGLLAVADSAARIMAAARAQRGAPPLRERVRMALAKAHERWQAAVAAVEQQPTDENFHLLRIKTKGLRYRIELAGELGLPAAAAQIAWLRRLQDRLGRWHDRRELSLSIARTLGTPAQLLAQPRVAIELIREVERNQRQGQAEMARILGEAQQSPGRAGLQRWIEELSASAPLSGQEPADISQGPKLAPTA